MTSPNENYTSWYCGMKVVLVDDQWVHFKANTMRGNSYPTVGGVYIIRDIGMVGLDGEVALRLAEIQNPVLQWPDGYVMELAFAARRFRPVQTRPTSIAIFQRILSNPHKKIHNRVEA